jgi:nitroreductase
MLTVAEAIERRRSIRSFQPKAVPEAMIMQLLEAARQAPSGSNSQPWRFVVVTDAAEKKELRRLSFNQAFIEEAGVNFIFCADLSSYSKDAHLKRRQEAVDAGILPASSLDDTTYKRYMEALDKADPSQYVAPATANTYIAVEHIVLMAEALGLGSCWVGGISDPKAVREMLGIPHGILVLGLVSVGYASAPAPARPRLAMSEILLRPYPPAEAK